MSSHDVLIRHIFDEIDFLLKNTEGKTFEEFMADEVLKRAAARSRQIMGDAAKNISAEFRQQHADIDWKGLAGMRDKLVHHYFGVSWNVLWDVVKNKLPQLEAHLKKIGAE
jgi:uncharacterized protein with HEPN domain